jgi:hypothetical protein
MWKTVINPNVLDWSLDQLDNIHIVEFVPRERAKAAGGRLEQKFLAGLDELGWSKEEPRMSVEWLATSNCEWSLMNRATKQVYANATWDKYTSCWGWFLLGKWPDRIVSPTLEDAKATAEKALREVAEQILREVGVPA